MEGNIPTKLDSRSSDKYALPVSPLDVCLGYFATSCLKPTEEPDIETDVEAMSFVLTSLLDDYDSIYCLNFQQLFQLLMVRFLYPTCCVSFDIAVCNNSMTLS